MRWVWGSQILRWLEKYKLCKVLALQLYHWCCIEGKNLYRKLKILTTWSIQKLRQLIICITPYCQSFIASSSTWPIVGLFLPNKSVQVDKACQACFRSTTQVSHFHSYKPRNTSFTS